MENTSNTEVLQQIKSYLATAKTRGSDLSYEVKCIHTDLQGQPRSIEGIITLPAADGEAYGKVIPALWNIQGAFIGNNLAYDLVQVVSISDIK